MIFTPSTLIDGVIQGSELHCSTFFVSFPIAETFCNNVGRLCTILTDLPGFLMIPFSIILIPLLAVQEKSPRSGFTRYVYHSLPTRSPFFVFFIISSFVSPLPSTLRLCGNGKGIGCAFLPIGEPTLLAFPVDSLPSLNA